MAFKLMLAATVDVKNRGFKDVHFPVMASPKLDGVRATVINGVVMSRNMLPIPNGFVQEMFGKPEYNGFDGELVVGQPFGEGVFNRTTSGVMSMGGEPDVTYHVFDDVSNHGLAAFRVRIESVRKRTAGLQKRRVVMVEHVHLLEADTLRDLLDKWLAKGYEGACLRHPERFYKQGRSTLNEQGLLKVKPFEDSEAIVLGSEEAKTNTNEKGNAGRRRTLKAGLVLKGTLGKLRVRDIHTGVEFMLGCGTMKQDEAQALWDDRKSLPGRIAKYKYQKVGTVELPRQPIFLGWRHELDTPKPRTGRK